MYKGLAWLKGLVEDLGLGFGWAAFYFTMFTALWYGQTPGKKLFNIRVIQLDGTPLSVWDSFGRYGGYGAGIATGLTPNRRCELTHNLLVIKWYILTKVAPDLGAIVVLLSVLTQELLS